MTIAPEARDSSLMAAYPATAAPLVQGAVCVLATCEWGASPAVIIRGPRLAAGQSATASWELIVATLGLTRERVDRLCVELVPVRPGGRIFWAGACP